MFEVIERLDNFILTHNQKEKGSLLFDEVKGVLACNIFRAKSISKKLCNVLSTYALLYALLYTEMSFPDFFRYLIDEGDVDKKTGWITTDKEIIFQKLGHDINLIEYNTIDNLPSGLYQIKIENKYGTHFMAGYVIDDILYLSDTSFRGIHVKASDAIKNDKLIWVKRYEHC